MVLCKGSSTRKIEVQLHQSPGVQTVKRSQLPVQPGSGFSTVNSMNVGNLDFELDSVNQQRFVAWNATGDYVVYSSPLVIPISIVDVSKLQIITEIGTAMKAKRAGIRRQIKL